MIDTADFCSANECPYFLQRLHSADPYRHNNAIFFKAFSISARYLPIIRCKSTDFNESGVILSSALIHLGRKSMNLKALCSAGFVMLAGSGLANAVTISYPDFSDLSAFTINGSAAGLNPSGNVLNLTDGLGQGGSAFLTNPVTLMNESSFSTTFQFRIDDPVGASDTDGQGADGIVFVVQTVANNVGGGGGGIGYLGIGNSVGVEFDTWNNGSFDDNNGNHVGIDLGGSVDSVVQSSIATRMNNGAVWSAWVDYDGLSDLLEVRLSETGVRPVSALLSYSVDLVAQLGQADAFIGFTSGTGAAGGDHDILNWTFVDDFEPIDGQAPTPGVLALLGLGMLGMRFAQKRK